MQSLAIIHQALEQLNLVQNAQLNPLEVHAVQSYYALVKDKFLAQEQLFAHLSVPETLSTTLESEERNEPEPSKPERSKPTRSRKNSRPVENNSTNSSEKASEKPSTKKASAQKTSAHTNKKSVSPKKTRAATSDTYEAVKTMFENLEI
ncbi:hypothetical protein [Leptolyngbya sp. FACHB-261]|uniref:hypothetical protein n=1 Tax=Leptolyngbya sp. FACHB-261 TaxID=2692806 RepID=UPI001687FF30|nr:hypothetical protein [Leptolyngbya sp. FACHB-261]MBD2099932.1 hypothetical protein [Leptolyngbya sp. FACHB-261]